MAYYVVLDNRAKWKFKTLNAIFSKRRNATYQLLPKRASIMSAVSGYWHISLIAMGGILHNERILRYIRNLINVSLFSIFFVYSLYTYLCFNLLLVYYSSKLKNYVLGLITYELTKTP